MYFNFFLVKINIPENTSCSSNYHRAQVHHCAVLCPKVLPQKLK